MPSCFYSFKLSFFTDGIVLQRLLQFQLIFGTCTCKQQKYKNQILFFNRGVLVGSSSGVTRTLNHPDSVLLRCTVTRPIQTQTTRQTTLQRLALLLLASSVERKGIGRETVLPLCPQILRLRLEDRLHRGRATNVVSRDTGQGTALLPSY